MAVGCASRVGGLRCTAVSRRSARPAPARAAAAAPRGARAEARRAAAPAAADAALAAAVAAGGPAGLALALAAAPPALAEEAAAAAAAAAAPDTFIVPGLDLPIQTVILSFAPIILYFVFTVYRTAFNRQVKIVDFAFTTLASLIGLNIVLTAVFQFRLF